jgi:hypothetical protein
MKKCHKDRKMKSTRYINSCKHNLTGPSQCISHLKIQFRVKMSHYPCKSHTDHFKLCRVTLLTLLNFGLAQN